MSYSPAFLLGDEVHFEHDSHAYRDADGSECLSVTQAIQIAGLIDYSMVRPEYLDVARKRGELVHQACALADRGEDLNHYVMPDLLWPYISAYLSFVAEMKFLVNPDLVERVLGKEPLRMQERLRVFRAALALHRPQVSPAQCPGQQRPSHLNPGQTHRSPPWK